MSSRKDQIPKMHQKQSSASEESSGVPRRFNRSQQRMQAFNENKVSGSGPGAVLAHAFKTQLELENLDDATPKKTRFRKAREGPRKAKTPSAPSNLPSYEGQCHGLHAAQFVNSHNFDYSSFPIIARELHQMLTAKETTLSRALPFCVFQHYLSTILNATIIKRVMMQNVESEFSAETDPFEVIHADRLWIPSPFYHYINGIGSNLLQTGDRIYYNLPTGGIPRWSYNIGDNEIPSGSFGECDANSHNAYECYVSPLVTSSLIDRTLHVFDQPADAGAWMPLPLDLVPAGATATKNLLGYELPERIRNETANILQRFQYENGNTMAGRLRFSNELMNHVTALVFERRERFNFTEGIPRTPPINPAAFIFHRVSTTVPSTQRLASYHGALDSCEAAGASASNMSSYFGYKRMRTNAAPGYCLLPPQGVYADWNATMNSNVNMVAPFQPRFGQDFPFLRDVRFSEASLSGTREASIRPWIANSFIARI